jgi:alpha-mannosidase
VVVFNSLSHRRHELITVDAPTEVTAVIGPSGPSAPSSATAEGRAIFEADRARLRLPGLRPGGNPSPPPKGHRGRADARSLENDHLRIELDDQGLLSSIFDKSARRQVLAPGARGNRFQLHPDYPNFYDAWDIDRFAFDQVVDLDEVESVEVVEAGSRCGPASGSSAAFGDSA